MSGKRPANYRRYAAECQACGHLFTGHRLAPDGDLVAGPYRCRADGCGCEVVQDAPIWWLSREQFEAKYGAQT